jgi:hypothetical protein
MQTKAFECTSVIGVTARKVALLLPDPHVRWAACGCVRRTTVHVSFNQALFSPQDAYLKFKVRLGSGPPAHSALLDDFASSGRELSDHLLSEHNTSGGGGGGGGGDDDVGETAVPISRMPRAMSPAEKRRSHSASLSRLLGE